MGTHTLTPLLHGLPQIATLSRGPSCCTPWRILDDITRTAIRGSHNTIEYVILPPYLVVCAQGHPMACPMEWLVSWGMACMAHGLHKEYPIDVSYSMLLHIPRRVRHGFYDEQHVPMACIIGFRGFSRRHGQWCTPVSMYSIGTSFCGMCHGT